MTIVFRADVSKKLGLGHAMRCLAIAHEMHETGPFCLVARGNTEVLEVLPGEMSDQWAITLVPPAADDREDARITAAVALELDAELIISDLCSTAYIEEPNRLSGYHLDLKSENAATVLSIEDCRMTAFSSDIAVIPYDCGDPSIADRASHGSRVFAGPEYYICAPQIIRARHTRNIRDEATRILIVIGGSDKEGGSLKIAKALQNETSWRPELRVIAGRGLTAEQKYELEEICTRLPDFHLVEFTDSIADHLVWADLAVVGEGLMRFEAAITGTPSITISQFEHDSDVLARFYAAGTTQYLGSVHSLEPAEIADGIRSLAQDPKHRRDQMQRGMALYDGLGAARLSAIIQSLIESKKQ